MWLGSVGSFHLLADPFLLTGNSAPVYSIGKIGGGAAVSFVDNGGLCNSKMGCGMNDIIKAAVLGSCLLAGCDAGQMLDTADELPAAKEIRKMPEVTLPDGSVVKPKPTSDIKKVPMDIQQIERILAGIVSLPRQANYLRDSDGKVFSPREARREIGRTNDIQGNYRRLHEWLSHPDTQTRYPQVKRFFDQLQRELMSWKEMERNGILYE